MVFFSSFFLFLLDITSRGFKKRENITNLNTCVEEKIKGNLCFEAAIWELYGFWNPTMGNMRINF